MARNIECDRCHKTEKIGFHNDWCIIEVVSENAKETTHEICPSCKDDLYRFLIQVEPPKLVTSRYSDNLRHVFELGDETCECKRYKLTIEAMISCIPDVPDDDIAF